MKNKFWIYFIGWVAMLALFNVIAFVTPNEIAGVSKFTAMFWVAYGFVTVEFIILLVASAVAFKAKPLKQVVYSLPAYTASYVCLILMTVAGCVCVATVAIPKWVGIIICSVILAVHITILVATQMTAGRLTATEQRVQQNTMLIRNLTAEAQTLVNMSTDVDMSKCAKDVYEAFRYSDPMSHPALQQVEGNICSVYYAFASCVKENNVVGAQEKSKELLVLVAERNAKCKIYK